MSDEHGFLARWARRKSQARSGVVPAEPAEPAPGAAAVAGAEAASKPAPEVEQAAAAQPELPPLPTMEDVARLTPESDFSRFVARNVDPDVRNAALKKLFADPHFSVMDGLDVYIDDYSKPAPIPRSVLRQMVQARLLGLFDDEDDEAAARHAAPSRAKSDSAESARPAADNGPKHEDSDLQLQPDDAARSASADESAGSAEG